MQGLCDPEPVDEVLFRNVSFVERLDPGTESPGTANGENAGLIDDCMDFEGDCSGE